MLYGCIEKHKKHYSVNLRDIKFVIKVLFVHCQAVEVCFAQIFIWCFLPNVQKTFVTFICLYLADAVAQLLRECDGVAMVTPADQHDFRLHTEIFSDGLLKYSIFVLFKITLGGFFI